jgi:hypothetical protein
MMPMPQPKEIAVIREDDTYVIIDGSPHNNLAIRKPISPRWKQRKDTYGRLISIQLIADGVA